MGVGRCLERRKERKKEIDKNPGSRRDALASEGFGKGCLHAGGKKRLRYCRAAGRLRFFLFTCSIRLVNHGLYYSSPGVNKPGVEREREGGRKREREGKNTREEGKQTLNHSCIHTRKDSSQASTKTKQFCMT